MMSRDAAHTLLNAAKAGLPTTASDILRALKATGDLEPLRRPHQAEDIEDLNFPEIGPTLNVDDFT